MTDDGACLTSVGVADLPLRVEEFVALKRDVEMHPQVSERPCRAHWYGVGGPAVDMDAELWRLGLGCVGQKLAFPDIDGEPESEAECRHDI